MKNQSIYHLLLDRFAGDIADAHEPVFAGGTLRGAASRLGYIADLGCDAVWISPFYKTASYHGYHITDFYSVDPHFGTEDDLVAFVRRAHGLGLKVYADFVPNHLSREHPYFVSARNNARSPYHDWFYWEHWPDKYRSFLFYDEIPKINLNNRDAREHILGAAHHWMAMGLDGLRVDHAIGVPMDFNREFYARIKMHFPDSFIFGEVWAEGITRKMYRTINIPRRYWRWLFGIDQSELQYDYAGCFDALLDFSVQNVFRKCAAERSSAEVMRRALAACFKCMPAGYTPLCFLDNHDMDRYIYQAGGDREMLMAAISVLCELPSPIALYYGTESGAGQTESIKSARPHADLAVRQPMNWGTADASLRDRVRAQLAQRAGRGSGGC